MRPGTVSAVCVAFTAIAAVRAQVPDWRRLPVMTSTATKGMAFDQANERMTMFESSSWGDLSRTWVLVDDQWSLRRTTNSPSPRDGASFAYDPVRQRCVLFGGTSTFYWTTPGALLADTWEFDGIDWRLVAPAGSPPAQYTGWLGFDHVQQKLLLCGGVSYPTTAGAWHFDGIAWTAAAAAPFYAHSTALASDPVRQRIVAFQRLSASVASTHEWDGAAWNPIVTTQQPAASYPGMLFVPSRGTTVAHGGYDNATSTYRSDLWEWNGSTWNQLPSGNAPVRAYHTMVHDPVRGRTVIIGGSADGNLGSDTVQWDGIHWTSSGPGIGFESLGNIAFDGNRQRVVAVTTNPLQSVAWDGERWSVTAPPPGATSCSGLGFDAVRSRLVAIGSVGPVNQTWEHDGTAWLPGVATAALPAYGRCVFHAGMGRVVYCANNALYEWTGTAWNQFAPGPGPFSHGAAYDSARNEIVVPQGFWGTTWYVQVWNGVSWRLLIPPTSPPVRTSYQPSTIGYDPSRQRVVVFGGRDPVTGNTPNQFFRFFDDLWEWDGATWSQRMLAHAPHPREGAAIVFDPVRNHLLVLGGNRQEYNGAYKMFTDVWALDSATPAAVTMLGAGCGGPQLPKLVPSAPHPGVASFTMELHRAPPNAPALFLFATTSGTLPLGGGCTSHLPQPDLVVFRATNAHGFASTQTSIPLALQGFSFAAQATTIDPNAPTGFAMSDGLRVTIGR